MGWNREKKQPFTELRETEKGAGLGINNSSVLDVLILRMLKEYPNEIELVTLGPLTNIALAITKSPEIASKIDNYLN